MIGMRTAVKTL